ncbi:hypothetical protein [Nonomuraea aurantiaca]|jgi:hypothetical protein|uniref:hypothetical protein n=1 Tax=Nonomuraea aurantiaca TaxID=2878562 RepID=UPI001CDA0573|nr:hypothetical protein [Nonomuraea aurantiaca]MCA2222748.1 hypothetical protein [Nonomuraea aurantiaca]
MLGLVDRLLTRVAHKVTVEAGCSNYYYCSGGIKYLRQCCLDQGCQTVKVGKC